MKTPYILLGVGLLMGISPEARSQAVYTGSNVTGQLVLTGAVNLTNVTRQAQVLGLSVLNVPAEKPKFIPRLHPPLRPGTLALGPSAGAQAMQTLTVNPASSASGFNGLTHLDQRLANGGNQFSVEPPNPSIAAGNGYVLEGVNNAVEVYSEAGTPLLPSVVTSNQVFGLAPAIIRATGFNGPFPTDMRVFYDQAINRWFILQRAQDNDSSGNLVNTSHLYLAVSQTGDPTGTYNIYTMDTTNANNFSCPCFSDYPQIGADQYGFYISANEYNTFFPFFVDSTILAISKSSLGAGAASPTTFRFAIPLSSGYEFAIQPASTPPGGSNFLASGGIEYFASTQSSFASDNHVAIWAMFNTSSLLTTNPNPTLVRTLVTTLSYLFPDVATQRPGPRPYGSTLTPPGLLEYLDGSDSRILSLSYAGGRLFATFATQVNDNNGRSQVGGVYVILSPTFRSGVLAAPVLRQGYLAVNGNHVLRPGVAVNAQGRGAIALTLVGADYYPTAAFLPIDTLSTGATVQISSTGFVPEDGFSGYSFPGLQGVARWGDYSTAVAGTDGSIWMTTEYIPNLSRTQLANWGTYVSRYVP